MNERRKGFILASRETGQQWRAQMQVESRDVARVLVAQARLALLSTGDNPRNVNYFSKRDWPVTVS